MDVSKELIKVASYLSNKTSNEVANKDGSYQNFTGTIDYKGSKGEVEKATFELKSGKIYWNRGTWRDGFWNDGAWYNGIWISGTWENGTWKGGIWDKGIWINGIWEKGTWSKGHWNSGVWNNGKWKDGTWHYGVWNNGSWGFGTWKDGIWNNGEWINGTWENGDWKKGTWRNGTWKNGSWGFGTWENGYWYNGLWKDGYWKGGTWKGGKWLDKKNPHPNAKNACNLSKQKKAYDNPTKKVHIEGKWSTTNKKKLERLLDIYDGKSDSNTDKGVIFIFPSSSLAEKFVRELEKEKISLFAEYI